TGADLTGANLTKANFYGANLTNADLTDTTFTYANLYLTTTTGAFMDDAGPSRSKLSLTTISGATRYWAMRAGTGFQHTNLTNADYDFVTPNPNGAGGNQSGDGRADLRGADLSNLEIRSKSFANMNLAGADL
ncbi:MAG TPA: hypothetical protein DF783_08440, partial [Acidimicrobiaceae bacterium]|nr:hypothetical protein [Acidimicrobiaceae bacterium]